MGSADALWLGIRHQGRIYGQSAQEIALRTTRLTFRIWLGSSHSFDDDVLMEAAYTGPGWL